jgi:hypothetical protein
MTNDNYKRKYLIGLLSNPKVLRIFFCPHASFATSPVLREAIVETVIKDLQENYNETNQ